MRTIFSIIAIAFCVSSCNAQKDSTKYLSVDDYAIYSLLINGSYPPQYDLPNRYIGIHYCTVNAKWVQPYRFFQTNKIEDTVWTNRDTSSKDSSPTLRKFSNSTDYDSMEKNFLSNSVNWITLDSGAFHLLSKYRMVQPHKNGMINIPRDSTLRGVVIFSRITFNSKKNEALVYFNDGRSSEAYSANYLLRKHDSVWVVAAEVGEP